MTEGVPLSPMKSVAQPAPVPRKLQTRAEIMRAIERISNRLSEIGGFEPTKVRDPFHDPAVAKLTASISSTLGDVFGHGTPDARTYAEAARFVPHFAFMNRDITPALIAQVFQQGKEQSTALLQSAITSLKERLETASDADGRHLNEVLTPEIRNKVFIVHGHDDGAKHELARFLERLELKAVILHEQPNQGRTIIEKFIACSAEVGFAVVLLTPDDLGGAVAAASQDARARQNVVFELGYFVAKLGRGKVCLLRKGEVEIPSDLYGVIYTKLDQAEGWKVELVKEMKAAGLAFDANKVWE